MSPKKAASSAIFSRTLRTISPKYIPEINFSKICEGKKNWIDNMNSQFLLGMQQKKLMDLHNLKLKITCSPGFKLSLSIAWSYSVSGRWDDLKLPHSMFITYIAIFQHFDNLLLALK